MKFEINEKTMKNILEKAVAAIDKKSSLDMLKRLYFNVNENTLEIMVQNYNTETIQLALYENILNIGGENGKFAIHVDDVPIITKMKDIITMSIEEDGKLYVKSGKKKVNIPLYEYTETEIEPLQIGKEENLLNIPCNEFIETCLSLSIFAEKESPNELLNVIKLDGKNSRMIALDGHRMAIKHLKDEYIAENNIVGDVMLHVYTVPILKKIISKKDCKNLSISFDGKYIVLRNNDFELIIKNVEGQYFKVDQWLVGNGKGRSFSCNRKELLNIMKYDCDITKKEDKIPVVFYQSNGKMNVYCKSSRYECIDTLETKESYIQDDFMIGFNPQYYIDALEIVNENDVMIEFNNPKYPAFINTEEYIFLILPVNINCAKDGQLMEHVKKAVA